MRWRISRLRFPRFRKIVVRLHQLAASVGDGHTGVHLPPFFKRYPLNVYWFRKDLRVIAARQDYTRALGTRVRPAHP